MLSVSKKFARALAGLMICLSLSMIPMMGVHAMEDNVGNSGQTQDTDFLSGGSLTGDEQGFVHSGQALHPSTE